MGRAGRSSRNASSARTEPPCAPLALPSTGEQQRSVEAYWNEIRTNAGDLERWTGTEHATSANTNGNYVETRLDMGTDTSEESEYPFQNMPSISTTIRALEMSCFRAVSTSLTLGARG